MYQHVAALNPSFFHNSLRASTSYMKVPSLTYTQNIWCSVLHTAGLIYGAMGFLLSSRRCFFNAPSGATASCQSSGFSGNNMQKSRVNLNKCSKSLAYKSSSTTFLVHIRVPKEYLPHYPHKRISNSRRRHFQLLHGTFQAFFHSRSPPRARNASAMVRSIILSES